MFKVDRTVRSLAPLLAGFALLFVVVGFAVALYLTQQDAAAWVRHTLLVENRLNRIQTLLSDAETAQRGFLLTGKESYVAPYDAANLSLPGAIDELASRSFDNEIDQTAIDELRQVVTAKLAEMQSTVDLRRAGRPDEALAIVNNDSGSTMMDRIRTSLSTMRDREETLLQYRSDRARLLNTLSEIALVVAALVVMLLGFLTLRDARRRLLELEASNAQLARQVEERIAVDAQVRQLQKMEAVGQLTGGIAHDFNNMLAIIIGSLDMARRRLAKAPNPEVATFLDHAVDGAKRAATLTARLLAFSRQQPLDPKPFNANAMAGTISELLRRTLGETVQIETVLAGGLWPAFADLAQLESALVNLAVNARDAMAESGGRLTIETANADLDDRYARSHNEVRAGQYVMISVTDNGTGMAPEVIERAFDPFYTTKGIGKGTGLGLSQVYGFVKQSGGHVKIYSELGYGTTVKIYLPRYVGPESVAIADATLGASAPKGRADEIIFVVEDEAEVRRVVVEALRELGYSVIEAGSPKEALERMDAQDKISLLLTDIVMPDMSGRQLADKALETRPTLKVLYTTGYTRNAVVHNGVLDPGTAFLAKPFTIDQLAAKVRDVLGA